MLCGYSAADMRLLFSHMQMADFLMMWLNLGKRTHKIKTKNSKKLF